MSPQYFLWSGIREIEDLDEDHAGEVTYEQALAALKNKTEGDWTLWLREGYAVQLLAVSVGRAGSRLVQEIRTGEAHASLSILEDAAMYGESLLDWMSDEDLLRHREPVQREAMRRRRDHCEEFERKWCAVVIGEKRPGSGFVNRGVVMIRRDKHFAESLELVQKIVREADHDCTAAAELLHRGFAVVGFAGLDKYDKSAAGLTLQVDFYGRPRETGRTSVRYPFTMDGSRPADADAAELVGITKGRMESTQPSVQNLPKFNPDPQKGWPSPAALDLNVELVETPAPPPDQVLICQQCQRRYKFGDSNSEHPICFCSGLCQAEYRSEHGDGLPPVGGEIPLGEPQTCNLQAVDIDAALAKVPEGQALGGYGAFPGGALEAVEVAFGEGDPAEAYAKMEALKPDLRKSEKEMAKVMRDLGLDNTPPTAVPPLSAEEEAFLKNLEGLTVGGEITLPSGKTVPAPRTGYVWHVADGKLEEKPDLS